MLKRDRQEACAVLPPHAFPPSLIWPGHGLTGSSTTAICSTLLSGTAASSPQSPTAGGRARPGPRAGCDCKYSAPVTSYQLIASNYILLHELLPTPVGMNLTLVTRLLVHEDLKWLMTQVRENGQKTLITVHHDVQEIHPVMERVKRDERHRSWDTLFGWSPAATGIFNKMLHPVIVLLTLTVLCFILTVSLYVKLWFMMKRLASLRNVHALDKPHPENVCDIPDIFQLS